MSYERLVPFGAGNLLEGNIHVIDADGTKHDPITHQGETVGYVIQGKLELTIEGTALPSEHGRFVLLQEPPHQQLPQPGPEQGAGAVGEHPAGALKVLDRLRPS